MLNLIVSIGWESCGGMERLEVLMNFIFCTIAAEMTKVDLFNELIA